MNTLKQKQESGEDDRRNQVKAKTTLVSHNITVMGKRTSIRLEPEMWSALREISKKEGCRVSDLCSLVYLKKNRSTSLTGAIRVFMMLYYRAAVTDAGHEKAGHGDFRNMIKRAGIPLEFFPRYTEMRYAGTKEHTDLPAKRVRHDSHAVTVAHGGNATGRQDNHTKSGCIAAAY